MDDSKDEGKAAAEEEEEEKEGALEDIESDSRDELQSPTILMI